MGAFDNCLLSSTASLAVVSGQSIAVISQFVKRSTWMRRLGTLLVRLVAFIYHSGTHRSWASGNGRKSGSRDRMADSSTGAIGGHILACSKSLYQRPASVATQIVLHTTACR